jgi:BON domain-containing protein
MRVCLFAILAVAMFAIAGQQTAWAQRTNQLSGTMNSSRASSGSLLDVRGATEDTSAGEIQGNERFVRGSRRPGEFVGAGDTAGSAGNFVGSQMAGATPAGSRSNSGRSSLANRDGNQPNRSSRRSRTDVRTRVRLGFTVVRPAATDVVPRLHRQLEKIIQPRARSPIQIEVDKGTAILRGAVASAHDRAIAERLVLLEGGIWKVKNELTVSEAQTPPAPK